MEEFLLTKFDIVSNCFHAAKCIYEYKDRMSLAPYPVSKFKIFTIIFSFQGFKIEAKHYYEKAVALDPTNKILKDNIAKLQRTM